MERENRSGFMMRLFYVFIVFIMSFRFRNLSFTSGLDASWIYALNRFFNEGLLWGHDVIFTYGPLGFILCPMSIGYNAWISLAYWICVALSAGLILSYALFSERFRLHTDNVLISFTLFYLGSCLFGRIVERIESDYIITYIMLCLLSLCWLSGKFRFFFMASLLCVLSLFMKFNSGAINFVVLIIFVLVFNPVKYIPALMITPALFFTCFMIYNPSLSELYYYVKGAYEISSGYVSAMSLNFFIACPNSHFKIIAMIVLCFVILAVFLGKAESFKIKQSLKYASLFAVPVFGAFRHAFTRADGHVLIFIPILFIMMSVYILFMPNKLKISGLFSKFLKVCLCVMFAFSFITSSTGLNNADYRFKQIIYNALTNPLFELGCNISSASDLRSIHDERELKLPSEFLRIISDDSTAIYPFEISYAHDIPNYKSMPVFQAYTAYTSWLDKQNAEFYAASNAPKFIVFDVRTSLDHRYKDNRFQLIECPETWFEIFRNYEIRLHDLTNQHLFLLERRESRKLELGKIITQTYSISDVIEIPNTNTNLYIMNVDMNLNLAGKLMKTFYKIPEVLMTAEFEDGTAVTRRVLPEVLRNNTIISNLILNDYHFASFMNGDMSAGKVKSIRFSGEGLKFYRDEMSITFTEIMK